jgi:transposase-like protein
MKLSIQFHLAGLSSSNTVPILEMFGIQRARSTVHNWVHKADLQPTDGHNPNHVAVDETVIRLNDEQYWLYAAVDPDTNELLHTRLEPTTNSVLAQQFLAKLREKHDVDDVLRNQRFLTCERIATRFVNAVFLIDGSHSLKDAWSRHGLDLRVQRHGDRNSVERVFREVKRRTSSFSNCFSNARAETADEWLRKFAFAWNQLI